ncbi:MAG: hypothetical protein WDA16_14205 [Candidatus Thermoplasmatota archaeon]
MADEPRDYVIRVKRPWKLWILPSLAILYFVLILAMAIFRIEIRNVPTQTLVLGGVAFFVLVILIELPLFVRRRVRVEAPPTPPPAQDASATPMMGATGDDEHVMTAETQQGLRVIEYSAPAKSRNRGAVYAKTYVAVTKEHVLRVENLAAEPSEI